MENAITTALSKQLILARALDVTANNIANQTTAGYKAERSDFREYISRVATPDGGDPTVSLVYDPDTYTDFSAGGLQQTYAPFDFAIDGEGFFAIESETGLRYTRDGHLQLNSFGELTNRSGDFILDQDGSPILIDPERGPVIMSPEGELQQDGTPIAKIGVFSFEDMRSLRRIGQNNFVAADAPVDAESARLRQGFVEISNVSPMRAMTDMIQIMRAYESAATVIETTSQLARDAVQTLTRNV